MRSTRGTANRAGAGPVRSVRPTQAPGRRVQVARELGMLPEAVRERNLSQQGDRTPCPPHPTPLNPINPLTALSEPLSALNAEP